MKSTVFIPGARLVAEAMLRKLHQVRHKPPMKHVADKRFAELVAGAESAIAAAISIEERATTDDLACELYWRRCEDAKRAVLTAYDEPLARAGARQSVTNAERRADKPAASDWEVDSGRNERLRMFHQRQISIGAPHPTKRTAAEFGLSASQVRRIVKRA
ncbi:MAG: hypothetical protein VYB93_05775 [Pseudomonadota bacterium]|nr:hypothetical protein [Pseudomonadota bacterium]